MAKPTLSAALNEFRAAQDARKRDLRNAGLAADLQLARTRLDERIRAVLGRVPYRTRRVAELPPRRDAPVHLAVTSEVAMGTFRRAAGETLCGTPGGRWVAAGPVPCHACLQTAEKHVDLEVDPPTLGL